MVRDDVFRFFMAAAAAVAVATPAVADAQVIRSFSDRYNANETGDVRLFGNTVVSCSTLLDSSCADARNGSPAVELNNNAYEMVYVDVDSDPGTFNSSSATSLVPQGATVLFAGLYWGGETEGFEYFDLFGDLVRIPSPDSSVKDTVKFSSPVTTGYATVTASQCDETTVGSEFGVYYNCFADVTSLVPTDGQGVYTVADLQTSQGFLASGGWGLVVAYRDPAEPVRNLVVYDGFAAVTTAPSGVDSVDISISGFRTPFLNTVSTRVGLIGHEGDRQATNARASMAGVSLGDALNPANNVFNSTASDMGAAAAGRTPAYDNLMGFDVDLIDATGVLGNGVQSTTISVETAGDFYYPAVVTFATEIYAPQISFTKRVEDLDGGDIEPGDTLRYVFDVENSGGDFADEVVLSDTLAPALDYVQGSLTIDGASAGSRGDWSAATRTVTARIGSGAGASSGGEVGAGTSVVVSFEATVSAAARSGDKINNQGELSYRGRTLGELIQLVSDDSAAPGAADPTSVVIDQIAPTVDLLTPGQGATVGDRRPAITGTAEPGATVTVSIDGSAPAVVTVDANGDWSFTPGSDLSDGSHSITVRAEDAAGNSSTDSGSFNVDLTAPPLSVSAPADGEQVGPGDVVITGTTEPGREVTVTLTGGRMATVTADASGNWSADFGPLPEATGYTATATVEDDLGNEASVSIGFDVDTTAPAVSVDTPGDGADLDDARPTIEGTAEPGATVTVTVDGGEAVEVTVDGNGDWAYTPPNNLGEGDHEVVVTAEDAAGNTSSDSVTFNVDTEAPQVIIDSPTAGEEVETATPVVSGFSEPGSTVVIVIDGQEAGTVTAGADGAWSFTTSELGGGAHTVVATSEDDAGNVGEATVNFTVALPGAEIEIKRPVDGDTANSRRPVVEGVTGPGVEVQISIDGGEPVTVIADGEGRFEYTIGYDLADGEHTVSARTNDGAEDSVTFTVDPDVPSLSIDSPSGGQSVPSLTPEIEGTADPGQEVDVYVDGDKVGTVTADEDGNWSWTIDSELPEGEHTVRAEAVGSNGEAASVSVTFTVVDVGDGFAVDETVDEGCNCAQTSGDVGGAAGQVGLALFALMLARVRRRRRAA